MLTPILGPYASRPIREVERAMGIEPTREAPPELENKRFRATTHPKCDWGVNIPGMWGQ